MKQILNWSALVVDRILLEAKSLLFEKNFFMNIAKWSDGPLGTEIRPTWPENRPTLYFLLVIWTFIDRERSERGTSHEGLDSVAHTSSSV